MRLHYDWRKGAVDLHGFGNQVQQADLSGGCFQKTPYSAVCRNSSSQPFGLLHLGGLREENMVYGATSTWIRIWHMLGGKF